MTQLMNNYTLIKVRKNINVIADLLINIGRNEEAIKCYDDGIKNNP